MGLREDANKIISAAIKSAMPDEAVKKALSGHDFGCGKVVLVAVGKAAWQMAAKANEIIGPRITNGIVITKYNHSKGDIADFKIFEAGHPIPDENSFKATQAAIDMTSNLGSNDIVVLLLSGGGSALFEKPLINGYDLEYVTKQLFSCGAGITEMNTIRKRLSCVKGGRFAQICSPAKVFTIVLSDIIGDPLDMIASGPAYPDSSTCIQALEIVEKYKLDLPNHVIELLKKETPKQLDNVQTQITGSVRQLCASAEKVCNELGYTPIVLTDSLDCEARHAGSFMASIARYYQSSDKSLAFIAGGETVVHLTGKGLGGRNQEIALSCADGIAGLKDTAILSFGSDGTDGPTDAAGGFCDGQTKAVLLKQGINIFDVLKENDSYNALLKCGGLIKLGATGTNVNDLSVLLIKR